MLFYHCNGLGLGSTHSWCPGCVLCVIALFVLLYLNGIFASSTNALYQHFLVDGDENMGSIISDQAVLNHRIWPQDHHQKTI